MALQSCFYTAPKSIPGAFRQEIERMTGPVPSVREPWRKAQSTLWLRRCAGIFQTMRDEDSLSWNCELCIQFVFQFILNLYISTLQISHNVKRHHPGSVDLRPWKLIYPLKFDGWKMQFPINLVPFQAFVSSRWFFYFEKTMVNQHETTHLGHIWWLFLRRGTYEFFVGVYTFFLGGELGGMNSHPTIFTSPRWKLPSLSCNRWGVENHRGRTEGHPPRKLMEVMTCHGYLYLTIEPQADWNFQVFYWCILNVT